MSYYYSSPYGPVPNPMDSYWRYQSVTPGGTNSTSVPPFPSGSQITPQTPDNQNQANPSSQQGYYYNQGSYNPAINPAINPFSNPLARGFRSYIEDILRLNRGKMATIYMTFQSGGQGAMNKSFTGVVEAAGRDHIILSDPNTGHRYLLLMVYVDYIEFPQDINYYYPVDNTLNIVDPDLLQKFPELAAVYNYEQQLQAQELQNLEQELTHGDITQQY